MPFGKNIRFLRLKNDMSLEDLSKKLGYKSLSTIAKWESGVAEPSVKMIKKIAELFHVDFRELAAGDLTGQDSNFNNHPLEKALKHRAIRIPVLGSVPAGIPIEAIEDIVDWEDLSMESIDSDAEYFGLKVKGNSMYPKYIEGDTIIVKRQSDCESGDDAIVYVNGYDATLKKVIKQQFGIMLQPINPEYQPKFYDYGDAENPITIAGIVTEIRRKV